MGFLSVYLIQMISNTWRCITADNNPQCQQLILLLKYYISIIFALLSAYVWLKILLLDKQIMITLECRSNRSMFAIYIAVSLQIVRHINSGFMWCERQLAQYGWHFSVIIISTANWLISYRSSLISSQLVNARVPVCSTTSSLLRVRKQFKNKFWFLFFFISDIDVVLDWKNMKLGSTNYANELFNCVFLYTSISIGRGGGINL